MRVVRWRAAGTGLVLAITILSAQSVPVFAAGSGTALGVDPQARAERAADVVTLSVGADVFIGDRIVTNEGGLVQIRFSDGTKLVVGPNSAMVLEDYLLRADGSAGKFAISALSGTFRFVTGDAPKDSYIISTPTGTMGVRGTGFDFFVELLKTSVLSYHGAVVLCAETNSCVTLKASCEIGQVQSAGPEILGRGRNAKGVGSEFFREAFRYSVSQRELKSPFRISNASSCSRRTHRATVESVPGLIELPPVGEPPPVIDPPKPPKPPPSGNCAGKSHHNPGHSQNCNK